MTAALFVEAADTAVRLGWALAGWLVFGATVAAILLLAAIATGAWGVRGVWRAVRGVRRVTRRPAANLTIPAPIATRRQPQPSWVPPVDLDAPNASRSPESEKEPIA